MLTSLFPASSVQFFCRVLMMGVNVFLRVFGVGVKHSAYRAAGSAINGTWPCELGPQKARGCGTSLSSAVVQCSQAWPHL